MGLPFGRRAAPTPKKPSTMVFAAAFAAWFALVTPAASGTAPQGEISPEVLGAIAAQDILLRSGAGLTLRLDSNVAAAMGLPAGATPLEAVYSTAFRSSSWVSAEFESTITPAGQAAAIMAGIRLTRLRTTDIGRARLHALAAQAQADYALVNLVSGGHALTLTSEATAQAPAGQTWLLLEALSQLAVASRAGGVFENHAFSDWFKDGARAIHEGLADQKPTFPGEVSTAVCALAAYLGIADDPEAVATQIAVLTATMPEPTSVMDRAWALRTHLAAFRALGESSHSAAAEATFWDLAAAIDQDEGGLAGAGALSIWQVADLIGALSDARAIESLEARATATADALIRDLLIDSGVTPALPEPQNPLLGVDFDPPSLPAVDNEARWAFGSAIRFDRDAGQWVAASDDVDLPGALYAASQLLSLTSTPEAESGASGTILQSADTPSAYAVVAADAARFTEASGSPSLETAIILAVGLFAGMMALVVGMLQFMKGFEEQQ